MPARAGGGTHEGGWIEQNLAPLLTGPASAVAGPVIDNGRKDNSGDRYADRELHQRFLALYDEKHTIDQKSRNRAELDVGPDNWPMPIPLVQNNQQWT